MTQYHGGKQKLGVSIADVVSDFCSSLSFNPKGYLEPFCGMLGVFKEVVERVDCPVYIANDANKSVILMWKDVKRGWIPPSSFSKKQFEQLKHNGQSSSLKGFVGHACSYRGIYFAPYDDSKNVSTASLKVQTVINNFKALSKLKNIKFSNGDFSQYQDLSEFIIYCDPPYLKSSRYYDENGTPLKFDTERFYDWARGMAKSNIVFISENSPLPFTLVKDFGNEQLYIVS